MKTLNFNFSHPFRGHARVDIAGQPPLCCKQLSLDSKQNNVIEIPLDGFKSGKYNITLDWEVDNQFFVHQQEFEVNNKSTFIPANS
jgi:hypothetical protein